ncbi:MAG TPA: lamin tail domain-containing protein [Polyangiales bacterium]|nr:lamin tail domain-containing protein [Polyangiales bacterium]
MRLLLLCLLVGCFREPDGASTPVELRLSDLAGGFAASDEAPRDLELSLSFAGAPDDAEPLLMRGLVDASLLARLNFARPNAALASQLVMLEVERAPHALRSHPAEPLAPGRYTLVWPYGEPRAFSFSVSDSPALGARWVESAPGDGGRVPPNLSHVLVRFDGHVQGALTSALHLEGFQARVERCGAYGLPEGDCAWLTPDAPLREGRHELILDAGLFTPGGAPIPAQRASFEVAGAPDRDAPTLMTVACAIDERAVGGACVRSDDRQLVVHGRSDEPCFVTLLAGNQRAMTLSYAGAFALALTPKDVQGVANLRLSDLAGNVRELSLSFELTPLAEVTLDELRPDPLGAEPAQEYVELLNFGTETVALMGFTLSTDATEKGRTIATSSSLAPGERVLLVGPDFDARDANDGALPSGTKVVPLTGALGLANAGGELFLRDARGRRLSRARTIAPLVEGQCTRRVGDALRGAAWELDARGGCTPGADGP